MRDLFSNIPAVTAVSPATHSTTAAGPVIDLIDCNRVCIVATTGTVNGAGDFTLTLEESDTTAVGDFTAVSADHIKTNAPDTLAADAVYRTGYIGHKRYIRAVLTKNGGTSIQAAAIAVQGDLSNAPAV